jgi:lipopolysaccharide biosynthesis protein
MTEGFAVILVVMAERPESFDVTTLPDCEGVLVRRNKGYDFGAWASVIRRLPDLREARLLAIANDSLFGPLDGFAAMIAAARAHPAPLVAALDSREHWHHLQSFLLFFKPPALRSRAFATFWRRVRNGGREQAIRRYELNLERHFRRHGLAGAALFPSDATVNATLAEWRDLVRRGFPFLKVQLLRDNPLNADLTGWREIMAKGGYDPAIVDRYLAVNPPRSRS